MLNHSLYGNVRSFPTQTCSSNPIAKAAINETCLIHVTFKCIHSHSSCDKIAKHIQTTVLQTVNYTEICQSPELYDMEQKGFSFC